MEFFSDDDGQHVIKGDTLVIALPSMGNVSQLALDSLISSSMTLPDQHEENARIRRIGYLDSAHIIPVLGHECFNRNMQDDASDICVGLELYRSPAHKITLCQQRSVVRDVHYTIRHRMLLIPKNTHI